METIPEFQRLVVHVYIDNDLLVEATNDELMDIIHRHVTDGITVDTAGPALDELRQRAQSNLDEEASY